MITNMIMENKTIFNDEAGYRIYTISQNNYPYDLSKCTPALFISFEYDDWIHTYLKGTGIMRLHRIPCMYNLYKLSEALTDLVEDATNKGFSQEDLTKEEKEPTMTENEIHCLEFYQILCNLIKICLDHPTDVFYIDPYPF